MLIPRILMAASAAIAFVFGAIHLAYTFHGDKLLPRDPAVLAAMGRDHPGITRQTTMLRAWVGFNATHSIALLLFGLVFGYLAVWHAPMLFGSAFLLAVGLATLAAFLVLARLYFFSVPFLGVTIALGLYLAGIVASRFGTA